MSEDCFSFNLRLDNGKKFFFGERELVSVAHGGRDKGRLRDHGSQWSGGRKINLGGRSDHDVGE